MIGKAIEGTLIVLVGGAVLGLLGPWWALGGVAAYLVGCAVAGVIAGTRLARRRAREARTTS